MEGSACRWGPGLHLSLASACDSGDHRQCLLLLLVSLPPPCLCTWWSLPERPVSPVYISCVCSPRPTTAIDPSLSVSGQTHFLFAGFPLWPGQHLCSTRAAPGSLLGYRLSAPPNGTLHFHDSPAEGGSSHTKVWEVLVCVAGSQRVVSRSSPHSPWALVGGNVCTH